MDLQSHRNVKNYNFILWESVIKYRQAMYTFLL